LLVVGIIIAVGVLILVARAQERSGSGKHTSVGALISSSVVRSWIAIALVGGLLVLCAAAFAIDDSTVRSTLIGGLTASVGSAIAYYFASKSSEQSTAAIVQATTGMAKIPDLTGKTTDEAIAALGTSFVLGIDPSAASGAHVVSQAPPAGTSAAIGSPVVVKLGG
jgi:hypothetical protein